MTKPDDNSFQLIFLFSYIFAPKMEMEWNLSLAIQKDAFINKYKPYIYFLKPFVIFILYNRIPKLRWRQCYKMNCLLNWFQMKLASYIPLSWLLAFSFYNQSIINRFVEISFELIPIFICCYFSRNWKFNLHSA